MAKRRGATTRDPKVRMQPVDEGETSKADRRRAQRAANRAPVERLSPGVYRSAGGGLVSQQGQRIRRQPEPQGNPWAAQGEALYGAMPSPEQMGGMFGGANLSPEERLAQGIDPRDPNIYTRGPGGEIYGTLIGWNANQPSAGSAVGNQMGNLQGMPQMPQPSANQGGKYRLSPGVYGTREQAMQQYDQQMQEMLQPYLMSGTPQEQQQGGGGRGIANFPMDQRQREMGYVEDRFNAARNNNLFRGNPIKKLRF